VVNASMISDGTCAYCRAGQATQCRGRSLFGYSGVYPRLDGGQALERALMQAFNLESGQAAEYIQAYGLEEKLEGKVMSAIKPVFDIIVEELKRAQTFFTSRSKRSLSRLVFVGGTANLPGVLVYMAEALGVEVARGNPWETINVPQNLNSEYLEEHAPSFAVAAGLALKEI